VYADVNHNCRYDPGIDPVATTRVADAGPGRPAGSYELADVAPGVLASGQSGDYVRLVEHQAKPDERGVRAAGHPDWTREDVWYVMDSAIAPDATDAAHVGPQEHVVCAAAEPQTFPGRDFVVAPEAGPAAGLMARTD
jgi:hypothetical protein